MLQCPNCHLALRAHFDNDVEIDICDACKGIWLDAGELETLSNGGDFTPHAEAGNEIDRFRCPRCDTERFTSIARYEGELAQCIDCAGLFVEGSSVEYLTKERGRRGRSPATREAGDELATNVLNAEFNVSLATGILGDIFGW